MLVERCAEALEHGAKLASITRSSDITAAEHLLLTIRELAPELREMKRLVAAKRTKRPRRK
jgi:hypothetical protein